MLKSKNILLILFFFILFCTKALAFKLQSGDLIFQESYSNDSVGNAIKNVTQSAFNYHFTHVGIVYIPAEEDNIYVIEARPPIVRIVPLDSFLFPNEIMQCNPTSIVGRIDEKYQYCIPNALQEALKLIGKEYDYGFILNNDKYYCSELIYDIFLKANYGLPVFELNTMTFKEKNSNATDSNWIQYFRNNNLNIPEGELGINPGAMSRSKLIDMLGDIKYEASRYDSTNSIYGFLIDSLGRCIHYSEERDIIANKCYACNKYYSCYKCHNLCEKHNFEPWTVYFDNPNEKIVLCGNCFHEISYKEYKDNYSCNKCKMHFNPNCSMHSSIYFQQICR